MSQDLINEKLSAAYKLIEECEKLAEERGKGFTFSLGYGTGSTYVTEKEVNEHRWIEESGWQSSSSGC